MSRETEARSVASVETMHKDIEEVGMSILNGYPFRDMTPDDVRAIIRRAHAERAAAMRQAFASLLWWRRKAVERHTEPDTAAARTLNTSVGKTGEPLASPA
jgi:hypothetical protein